MRKIYRGAKKAKHRRELLGPAAQENNIRLPAGRDLRDPKQSDPLSGAAAHRKGPALLPEQAKDYAEAPQAERAPWWRRLLGVLFG